MTTRTLIVAAMVAGFALAAADSEAQRRRPGAGAGVAAPPAVDDTQGADELTRKRNEELSRIRKRFDDDVNLRKADEERKKQDDAEKELAANRQREAREAQKRAAFERERERKREERDRQAQCEVKPVMTDEDIARCRAAR